MTLVPEQRVRLKEVRAERLALAEFAHWRARKREALLLDLANLPDNRCAQFRRQYQHWYSLPENDQQLLERREQLRKVWSGSCDVDLGLAVWVNEAARSNVPSWLLTTFRDGRQGVHPNYHVLPLSLAIGATELAPKMAICANPECPCKYFLKGRKSQRFCDRPACAAYGQREHKRKWWKDHGQEWKEERGAKRKRRRKHAKAT